MDQKQQGFATIEGAVTEDQLTVEYWRERFFKLLPPNVEFMDLADKMGALDQTFFGTKGYFRLQNVNQRRAGLQTTAKAVRLILQLQQAGQL